MIPKNNVYQHLKLFHFDNKKESISYQVASQLITSHDYFMLSEPPCMTLDGKLCIFPFKYRVGFGSTKTHKKCTTDGITTSYPWCATKLKSDGHMDKFGECRADGTCEGV